jgi:hypothetical protein
MYLTSIIIPFFFQRLYAMHHFDVSRILEMSKFTLRQKVLRKVSFELQASTNTREEYGSFSPSRSLLVSASP